jgi:hypothetical protein
MDNREMASHNATGVFAAGVDYHFSGTHNYGNSKSGAYMCEKDTNAAGIRPLKTEMHPVH